MTTPPTFDDLVSLYFEDALDAGGLEELNVLLATRPDLAARFVHLGRIHGALRELEAGSGAREVVPVRRRAWLAWAIPGMAAAAFLALVGLLARPSARLEGATGPVTFDGSALETSAGGAATLVLSDGSRLHAGGDTALRLADGGVIVGRGTLACDVPAGRSRPLALTSPEAALRTSGARFFLSVELESTLCRVEEGEVRMERRATSESIDLRAGTYALAGRGQEFRPVAGSKSAPRPEVPHVRLLAPDRWPRSYALSPFHVGSLLYRDRGWEITTIPPELDGALGIVTLAEDRRSQEERLLVFEIDREADVWVGIDGRAAQLSKKLPSWLRGWEATGLRIHSKTASNSYYHLYRRRFPAGEVALGGNHCGGDTGAAVNYTVLVTPSNH